METIKLTIQKFRTKTKEELDAEVDNRESRYNMSDENFRRNLPNTIETNSLQVEITQEQFEAIRKSVIDKF
jgi:hypothetical protein